MHDKEEEEIWPTIISPPSKRYMLLSARVENCGLSPNESALLHSGKISTSLPLHYDYGLLHVKLRLGHLNWQSRDD